MKSKTFVMMFVAIGCGLVAAYLTARISARQAVPDSVPVLVAKEKIRAGDVIKEPESVGMSGAALAEVERIFHAQITGERLHPGAALAVYRHGRLVLDLVAGLADTQRVEPVRADTLFQLRSAGKPFASVAVLQLIERGKAGLDQPVAAYWANACFGASA